MIEKESRLETSKLSGKEKAEISILAILSFTVMGELFYHSVIPGLLFVFFLPLFFRFCIRRKDEKRKTHLRNAFSDFIYSVSSSVRAGKTLEKSLLETEETLRLVYGSESPICDFVKEIKVRMMELREPPQKALSLVAGKTGLAEIELFAEICTVCTETGGNLPSAIEKTESLLTERIEAELRIESRLSEKKLELRILLAMPVLILAFLRFSAIDYLNILYETVSGRVVMTIALAAMIGAYIWAEKMMNSTFES